MAPYADSIKDGFALANRNWQLIAVKLAATVLTCVLAIVLLVIPVAIIIASAGLNAAALTDLSDLPALIENLRGFAQGLISSVKAIMVAVFLFLAFLLLVSLIFIYMMGGVLGVLKRSIDEPLAGFSLGVFFSEANRLFGRMMGFVAAYLLYVIVFSVVSGAIAIVGIKLAVEAGGPGELVSVFIGILTILVLLVLHLVFGLVFFAVHYYGSAAVVMTGHRKFGAVHRAVSFLVANPSSFGWLFLMFIVFAAVSLAAGVAILIINLVFGFIPVLNIFVPLLMQLVSFALNSYMLLVITGSVMYDYGRKSNAVSDGSNAVPDGSNAVRDGSVPDGSILVADILDDEDVPPPPPPSQSAGPAGA